jgi:hypothetical protein
MKQICALVLAFICTGWTVTHERDRMSDKQMVWASASSGDATLLFGCMNGQAMPRLTWQSRKGIGSSIGVTWRIDDGRVQSHTAGMFSQDGRTLYPWLSSAPSLAGAKRLRVSVGGEVLDFDLARGEALPARWGC